MVTVQVKFVNGYGYKEYNFKCDVPDIKVGDMVVVESSNGLSVAKVTKIDPENTYSATKWVVSKVYMEEYTARVEKEKKLAEVKKRLNAKKKELQDIAIYEMLAEKDPEFREILAEYKSLTE